MGVYPIKSVQMKLDHTVTLQKHKTAPFFSVYFVLTLAEQFSCTTISVGAL